MSTANALLRFAAASAGVLVSGVVVARTGEAIAERTGLAQSVVGATLVALATSLPEVSTTWSAVRFGAYSMAVANIVGTNSLEVALLLPADLAFRDGPIIDAMDASTSYLAMLGIIVTAVYLWGVLERQNRTVLGMGRDSAIVLAVTVGGLALLPTI